MKRVDAYKVIAKYEDFDKSGGSMIMWNCENKSEAWKLAFYELWRYQMTWHMAYELEVIDGNSSLFVSVLCKKAFIDNLLNTMEGLGFKDCQTYGCNVGVIDGYRLADANDVEYLYIDY